MPIKENKYTNKKRVQNKKKKKNRSFLRTQNYFINGTG